MSYLNHSFKCIFLLFVVTALIISGCSKSTDDDNSPPRMDSFSQDNPDVPIRISSQVDFHCSATDPDGDALSYSWSASTGSLNRNDGADVTWTAPSSAGDATISVTVSDGQLSIKDSLVVTVLASASLVNGTVSPGSGNASETFTYDVTYIDLSGFEPNIAKMVVDGNEHTMNKISGDAASGILYRFETTLDEGSHSYYFEFTDVSDTLIHHPTEAYFVGPFVTSVDIVATGDIVIIDEQPEISFDSWSGSAYTFSYSGLKPEINAGDVLVGSDSTGYLRMVVSVADNGSQLVIQTRDIPLDSVLANVDFDTTITLNVGASGSPLGDGLRPVYLAPGVTIGDGVIDLSNTVIFSGTVGGVTVEAKITDGMIEFNPMIDIGLQLGWFTVKEFHAIAGGTLNFPCYFALTANGSFQSNNETTIAEFVHYHVYPMAGFPVAVKYTLSFVAGYEATVDLNGVITYGFEYYSSISVGARYEHGSWSSVWQRSDDFHPHDPSWGAEASAYAKAYVKPKLDIEIYSSVGPYIEMEPYFAFDGNVQAPPLCWDWELYAGINGYLGFQAHILGFDLFDYNTQLLAYRITLAEDATCHPEATIYSPTSGASFDDEDDISFSGGATDNEDGTLTGSSLVWKSNMDGQIGTGTSFSTDALSINQHIIMLIATDSDNNSDTASIMVDVEDSYQPNTVVVNSSPSGATVYLDGTNMQQTTPAELLDVVPGQHNVRLYKTGYNEYNESFSLASDEVYYIDATLTTPEPPLPVFTIYEPLNGSTHNDNVISVSGLIELEDTYGYRTPFDNNSAILTLNGVDQQIYVDGSGYFDEDISIESGTNTLSLRATSAEGNTDVSNVLTVYGDFTAVDIEITLTWNTPTSDIDLHVWNPLGEHCYYGYMNISDGSLDIDDVEGYGPETFTSVDALDGIYIVRINNYSLDEDSYADATVQLRLNGQPAQVFGPHHFTVDDHNGSDPAAWWTVIEFDANGGTFSTNVDAIPDWLILKIEDDMKSLPAKE